MRSLWIALLVLAGCGTTPDSRPVTFEVVTLEVLAPSCGQVQCHSQSTNTSNYAFDTIEASRASLKRGLNEIKRAMNSTGGNLMPPDSPLNTEDLDLFNNWVTAGTPGL